MIRAELPLDEKRVATYERLMEAQDRIANARSRAGASDAQIDEALENCEPANADSLSEDELYLGALARFVAALGGRLEVSAVFDDQAIAVGPWADAARRRSK